MNQHDRIIEYIKRNGSISTMEASQHLGIAYLTTRISEMRSDGVNITDYWAEEKNRYGDMTRFKRYTLEE